MLVRIISGAIGAIVLVGVLLGGVMAVNIALAILGVIAICEMYKSAGVVKNLVFSISGFALAAILPFLNGNHKNIFGVIVLYTILILVTMLFNHEEVKVEDAAKVYLLTLYITVFMACIAYIRGMEQGGYLIWTVVIGAFASDIFAYFVGVFFGKHKLCPKISPKKTIEGSIGGVVGSGLCFVLYGFILSTQFNATVSYPMLIGLGVVCAAISQLGDLIASIIKRQYGIKDYGKLMPGHGGVMDRCDSLIFVAPVIYLFLIFVGNILY
ncbi:MAG: phosphatidate cytidylyltransferase [Eubacteriales bacterium]|nr:phosphatidate cytidylyltransferase [Eubacteriales bacterium]